MTNAWDNVQIGQETGSVEFEVTDAMVDDYISATELDDRVLRNLGGVAGRIAPADLVPKLAMQTLFVDFMKSADFGPNVRVKQTFKFLRPVRVGTRVRGTGFVSDKYQKQDKQYVAFEVTFRDDDDAPLVIDQRVMLLLPQNFRIKS